MKVLSINAGVGSSDSHTVVHSDLRRSTPFGYDLIVVNPSSASAMYGDTPQSIVTRWQNSISKWANEKRRVVVLMSNLEHSDLAWLPIDQTTKRTLLKLESAGRGDFIGNVTSTRPIVRRFLTDNKQNCIIDTYLRYDDVDPNIEVHSGVDATLVTSFTYKKDNLEVLFVPTLAMNNLYALFSAFDTPANAWGVGVATDLVDKLSELDESINELHAQRDEVYNELNKLNDKISNTIESDVYLTRAIGHYDATKVSENPTPEGYYGAVEAIENAFSSEREMREELDLTKTYVDKVMRRANEFRHEAKSGQSPTPLTDQEIVDFNDRINTIISRYIDYLLNKN